MARPSLSGALGQLYVIIILMADEIPIGRGLIKWEWSSSAIIKVGQIMELKGRCCNLNKIFLLMNSKKVIRLKTLSRLPSEPRSPKQINYDNLPNIDEQTIMKHYPLDQQLPTYNILMQQIRQANQQIKNMRQYMLQEEQIRESLIEENDRLKGRLQMVEREYQLEKEKFLLERDNHERLREFYEKREKQWMTIICQQKKVIEGYEHHPPGSKTAVQTTARSSRKSFFQPSKQGLRETIRQAMRSHQGQRNWYVAEQRNLKQTKQSLNGGRFSGQVSETPKQLKSIKQSSEHKISPHNQDQEELFDKVLRRTIHRYRKQGKALEAVRQSEQLVKLRGARTTTKQRLLKCLRRLQFCFESQEQLTRFCGHLEETIVKELGQFRGDLVHDYLLDKLFQCQNLDNGMNSEIKKFEQQKSQVSISCIENKNQLGKENENEIKIGTLIDELNISSNIQVESQLQMNGIKAEESKVSRFGSSEEHSLSNLINGSRDYVKELGRV